MNERARTWGLRLLALAIAVAIWYSVSLAGRETLTERVVDAAVSYNQPRGFVLLDPVPSVSVRLRGASKKVRALNPYQVNVQVDLTQGQKSVTLGPDDVQVPEGFEVVSIDPSVIPVDLDREQTRFLTVRPQLVGEPAGGAVPGEPQTAPSQVQVTGPGSLLSRYEWINTRPINLDGHAETFEEVIGVIPPDPLIQVLQSSKVTVTVPLVQPDRSGTGKPAKPAKPAKIPRKG
jgi:YbbR domain-containing protein